MAHPQAVGQLLERLGQMLVGADGVGEHGVATELGDHLAAQEGDLRVVDHEADVGVPGVGARALGVHLEDAGGVGLRRRGRVHHQVAEAAGEGFLLGVGEVLFREEQRLVLEQRLIQLGELLIAEVGHAHAADGGADTTGDGLDGQAHVGSPWR
ncbi:hypothetical protein D3C81_1488820 [compost metagenome]